MWELLRVNVIFEGSDRKSGEVLDRIKYLQSSLRRYTVSKVSRDKSSEERYGVGEGNTGVRVVSRVGSFPQVLWERPNSVGWSTVKSFPFS